MAVESSLAQALKVEVGHRRSAALEGDKKVHLGETRSELLGFLVVRMERPAPSRSSWVTLHARHRTLLGRGQCQPQVVTALGRALLGFIWVIGVTVDTEQQTRQAVAA